MKKIVLSLAIVCGSFISKAQIIVTGISPASIVGNYNFTWADWSANPVFTTPGVFIQDTLMMVETGLPGTNAQGNPVSQEGCAALTNNLTGKIAVVFRNDCQFGFKALKAQQAGAVGVIIVNSDNTVIPMAGGTNESAVTIPVVMLSLQDGIALKNEMQNGDVVVFIGNKAGLFTNDLSIGKENAIVPRASSFPLQLAQNGSEFNMDLGLRAYNFGNSDLVGVTVKAVIKNPSGVTIYDETVGPFPLDGVNANVIDSVDIDPTEALNFPNFSQATYPAGTYTLTYSIQDADSTDDYMSDNMLTYKFRMANDLLAYGQLDANNIPKPNTHFAAALQPNTTFSSFSSCIHFKNANASRIGVDGLYFSTTTNRVNNPSIEGEQLSTYLYKWNNIFTDVNATGAALDDYELVTFGSYLYQEDLPDSSVYAPFEDQVILLNNQRYLFCVQSFQDSLFLGYNDQVDYTFNVLTYLEAVGPVESNGTYNRFGFGGDNIPSIGVKVFNAEEIGLKEFGTVTGSAYPNPANDKVSISVSAKGAGVLTITDLSGRTAYSGAIDLNTGSADVNVSDLKAGMYIFNVTFDNGQNAKFNVVKN